MNVGLAGLVCTLAACAHSASADVAIPAAPSLSPDWTALHHFVDSAVAAGAAPGMVIAASWPGGKHIYGTGRLGDGAPDRPDRHTQYDLASLTKVVGLTTALMFAVDEGRIDLDTPIQAYVPAFQGAGKERVTVRMLLAHAGGCRPGDHTIAKPATVPAYSRWSRPRRSRVHRATVSPTPT